MNVINLIGNICQDIELKTTQSGKPVVTLNLAVKRPFTKDTTDFITVVVWQQNAEYLSRYAHKGSKLGVTGKLTTRKYQDKDGNNRTAYEVVAEAVYLLDAKSQTDSEDNSSRRGDILTTYEKMPLAVPHFEEIAQDDDLPS